MNDFKKYNELRANIYKLLSFPYYKEPDTQYILDVKNMLNIFENIASINSNPEMAEGVEFLKKYFKKNDDEARVDELACAYARLFLVASMQSGIKGVSANESVYTSSAKLVMQEARDEVMEIYFSQNLANNREAFHEMEDHISAELYFMAQMAMKTVSAIDDDDDELIAGHIKTQRDFLDKHLAIWVDRLADDIVEITPSEFYKGVAKLTQGFVHIDSKILEAL